MSKPEGRRLSSMESGFAFCYEDAEHGRQPLMPQVSMISLTGQKEEDFPTLNILRQAAMEVCSKHKVLQQRVEKRTGEKKGDESFHFVPVSMDEVKNSLEKAIAHYESDKAPRPKEVFDMELNSGALDLSNPPFFRMHVLPPRKEEPSATLSMTLVFVLFHGVFDGMSVTIFINDLLTACSILMKDPKAQTPVLEGGPLDPKPAVDTLAGIKSSLWGTLRFVYNMIAKKITLASPAIDPTFDMSPYPMTERSTETVFRTLDSAAIEQLRKVCREHKVTLSCALSAAEVMAAFKVYSTHPNSPPAHKLKLGHGVLMSLRPYLNPKLSNDHLLCAISYAESQHRVDSVSDGLRNNGDLAEDEEKTFWAIAGSVKQSLTDASNDPFKRMRDMAFLKLTEAKAVGFSTGKAGGKQGHTALSNRGNWMWNHQYGSFALDTFHFGVGQRAFGCPLWSGAQSVNGKLSLTFAWMKPMIPSEAGIDWADTTINIVHRMLQGGDAGNRE